jgi:hypothetical protein
LWFVHGPNTPAIFITTQISHNANNVDLMVGGGGDGLFALMMNFNLKIPSQVFFLSSPKSWQGTGVDQPLKLKSKQTKA